MKHSHRIFTSLILFALLVVSVGVTARPAAAEPVYTCFPTCSTIDGRFLTLAGSNLATLAGDTQVFELQIPAGTTSFEIGIFDGDTGGMWDDGTTPTLFTVDADPLGDGSSNEHVLQFSGAGLPDNAWYTVTINTSPAAQTPSGNYFYHIHLDNSNPLAMSQNSLKLRTTGLVQMAPQAFAFVASLTKLSDVAVVYPNYPASLTPTTYDGTFNMYVNVPTSSPNFTVWDGDLDYGSFDCTTMDTNDPDTLDIIPDWALDVTVKAEGAASSTKLCANGTGFTTSNPPDDINGVAFLRSPAVTYDIILPDGTTYHNGNPSGNQEWEQFRISSNTADVPSSADAYHAGLLPAGVYQAHLVGMDMHNLNAWRFAGYYVIGVCDSGIPCVPVLHPFKIGDTVWYDTNGNGIQDNSEVGIPGVTVTLLDSNGVPIPNGTAVTDANGQYFFDVDAGAYSVQVDAGNFVAGGALAGMTSTTGGELQINTVTTDNVLTYDFGYRGTASIGDYVWKDLNGNGIQESGEPGIAGVTVFLLGSDGVTVVGSTTTDTAGNYSFTNLPAGTYYVQFVPLTGMIFTSANVGLDDAMDSDADVITGKTSVITLAAGQADITIDAGMQPIPTVNYCGYIRTPGFWKNYSNHMSSATFLNLIQHTQNFSYLTVSQAVKILGTNNGITKNVHPDLNGVDARFLKFLLTAEINAVWNGQDNAAALGGLLGTGYYQGTGLTVNQLLNQAYLNRRGFTSAQETYVVYLGATGEYVNASSCLVQR